MSAATQLGRLIACIVLLLGAAGCGESDDPSADASISYDGQGYDGVTTLPDGAAADATPADAESLDASAFDASFADSTPVMFDAMEPDASTPDAGTPDAASPATCIEAMHGSHYLRTNGTVVYWEGTPTVITVGGGADLTGVTEIFSGGFHGCARRTDGSVWCWPTHSFGNRSGQLGNGSILSSVSSQDYFIATPVMTNTGTPASLTGVDHINGGSSRGYLASNTCAVKADETLWCWGAHDSSGGGGGGLFNDGVNGNRAYAVPILAAMNGSPMGGVQAASVGARHACVIRNGTTNGEVWCWGANVGGPLGQNDETGRAFPVKVTLAGPADQLGAGSDATCARVADAVYCWGANNSGQIGIGDRMAAANHDGCINYCKLTPTQVVDSTGSALTGIVDLNMAYLSACALQSDDSLWCWGRGTAVAQSDWAIPAVINSITLDDISLHTTVGSSGYTQSLRYLTGDNKLMRASSEQAQLCP